MIAASRDSIGALLVCSGGAKLADVAGFARTLTGLRFPSQFAGFGAKAVASSELVLGSCVLAGLAPRVVNWLLFAAMTVMLAVASLAARWRPGVECRCFGALSESRFTRTSVIRAGILGLIAGMVAIGAEFGGNQTTSSVATTAVVLLFAGLLGLASLAAAQAMQVIRYGGRVDG